MDSEKMTNSNIQKHTLNLRAGDWDYIESVCKPKGIATSEVIRTLVRDLVDRWKKEEASELPDVDAKL
jgi:hypothetical protein